MYAETEAKKSQLASDDDSEPEVVETTPKRKQKTGGKAEPGSLPAWTKSEASIVYVYI